MSDMAENSKRVDELLARWISPAGPGAAVMVIKNHVVEYAKGFGLASLIPGLEESVTPKTSFRLASLTKQFTGMAIAMLCEQSKLSIDDRLVQFFPDQCAKGIRIRHLLYHTAGLRDHDSLFLRFGMIDDQFRSIFSPRSFFEPTFSDVHDLLKSQELVNSPPGQVFDYSNSGYVYLAAIIEKVSGESYGGFLEQRIFKKLGMSNTFVNDDKHPLTPNVAHSYDLNSVGDCTDIDYSPLNRIYGDDGIFSNLEDLSKWDRALYPAKDQSTEAETLVSDNTLKKIFESGTLNDNTPTGYGFGWFITGDGCALHDGAWAGYRAYIRRCSRSHFTIIVLTNFAILDPQVIVAAIGDIYDPTGLKCSHGGVALGTMHQKPVHKN